MAISIEELQQIFQNDQLNHNAWIAISDTKNGAITPEVIGDSGGNTGNAWKIHISIDPNKIAAAAEIICHILNAENAPNVSIKFAGKVLAGGGQPGKQVAFTPYVDAMEDLPALQTFLQQIDQALFDANIGVDPRPINSDAEQASRKWDAQIRYLDGSVSRFNYRDSNITLLEDTEMDEITSPYDNILQIGVLYLVRQSYFMQLPEAQKHNPAQLEDPYSQFSLARPQSNQAAPAAAATENTSTATPSPQPTDTTHRSSEQPLGSEKPTERTISSLKPNHSQATHSTAPESKQQHQQATDTETQPQKTKTKMPLGLKIFLGVLIALTFPISLPIFLIVRAVQKQQQKSAANPSFKPITATWTQPKSSQFKAAANTTVKSKPVVAETVELEQKVTLSR